MTLHEAADASLVRHFVTETSHHAQLIEAHLVSVREGSDPQAAAHEILRSFHTVKGMASYLGLDTLAALCHDLETAFTGLRDSAGPPDEYVIQRGLRSLDALRAAAESCECPPDTEETHDACRARGSGCDVLIRALDRTVTDTARRFRKDARLTVHFDAHDGRVIVAAAVAMLVDPLTQLARNAVAHGIETPAQRRGAGKSQTGSVMVELACRGQDLDVTVADDGAGIDVPNVIKRAARLGAVAKPVHAHAPQAADLIFLPGLSTARDLSVAGGRGMGLDLVRRMVERLHGTIDVASQPTQGTTIRIHIPNATEPVPSHTADAG